MKPPKTRNPSPDKNRANSTRFELDSMAQASALFGIPVREMSQAKRDGCDGFRHGRVQICEVVRWLWSRRQPSNGAGDTVQALQEEQARLTKWKADMAELEMREKERELVPLAEVQAMLRDSLLPVRQRLLSLPTECDSRSNPTDPAHARRALVEWVDQALVRLREAVAEVVAPKPTKKPTKKRKAKK